MTPMKIGIVNKSRHPLPSCSTALSTGMDLCAHLDAPVRLAPGARVLVPTGLYVSIPEGYEAQIRPRSGNALNNGITVLNTPGTIDADYRGEIGVIIVNLSQEDFVINDGKKIAQMVITKHETVEWALRETLDETQRGAEGFGHSDKKEKYPDKEIKETEKDDDPLTEREILYKILFDMRNDVNELKKLVAEIRKEDQAG